MRSKPSTARGLTAAEWLYLSLGALAVAISILKAPPMPINDAALFEYFGRAMLHGQRLYVDLKDNKPPSIYAVNFIWQALFGQNYFLHACAEGLLNLASFAVFAVMLRRLQVAAWALGTFLFAVFFSLPYPQFDFTQHYAVFFIVLALYLCVRGADFWGGIALAVATTFWLPALLTCIAVALRPVERRRTLAFAASFGGLLALGVIAVAALFGPRLVEAAPAMWAGYVKGSAGKASLNRFVFTVSHSALIPAVIALVTLLLATIRKPIGETSRFALVWCACALAGSFMPPNFSEHYYLPVIPALSFAIASFGLNLKEALRRPIPAVVAAVVLVLTVRQTVVNGIVVRQNSLYVRSLGNFIRESFGPGAMVDTAEYLPDIQLAAESRNIGVGWHPGQHIPDVIVAGPRSLREMVRTRRPVTWIFGDGTFLYVPVCPDRTGPDIAIYAVSSSASAYRCDALP